MFSIVSSRELAISEQIDPKYFEIRIYACWFKTKNSITGGRFWVNNNKRIAVQSYKKTKCLRLQIDEHLTWEAHIESVAKKSSILSCSAKRKLVSASIPENRIRIYKSAVEPYFDYCSIVWDNLSIELTDSIRYRLQNRVARIISGATYTKRSKDNLEKVHWLTLKQRRNEQKATMMYKIAINLAPEYMLQMFEKTMVQNATA